MTARNMKSSRFTRRRRMGGRFRFRWCLGGRGGGWGRGAVFVFVRIVRNLDRHGVQSQLLQPGGSRSDGGGSAHPRRGRDGEGVARCGTDDEQEKYVHRLHCERRVSGGARIWIEG